MSGDGCDVVPRRPPRETPEDRTRLPLELEALVGERVDTWQAALVDHVSEGEIVASVWAFIDRIRQKAAVAERERVARIIESGSTGLAVGGADGFWYMPGPKSRMVLAGSDLSLAVAAWLRSGGKEPGQ